MNHAVVGVLVRDEEGGLDVTTVGILATLVENFLEGLLVADVDRVVERQDDHLWHVI